VVPSTGHVIGPVALLIVSLLWLALKVGTERASARRRPGRASRGRDQRSTALAVRARRSAIRRP